MEIKLFEDRVLIKEEFEEQSTGFELPEDERRTNSGTVVAVGPGKKIDGVAVILGNENKVSTGNMEPMKCKVGDKVFFPNYGHEVFTFKGEDFILIKEEFIIGKI